jgi:hypothetical protein
VAWLFFTGLLALPPADETQGDLMKKKVSKKLTLSKETLLDLKSESLVNAGAGTAPVKTEWTICQTNCENCSLRVC